MAHKPNSRHLHGGDHAFMFGSTSSATKSHLSQHPTVVSTTKFSTLEFFASQHRHDNQEEVAIVDENFGDVDEDDYYDHSSAETEETGAGAEKSILTAEEIYQRELERLALEEESEETAFREEFLSDVLKPILDTSYKYPTVSVMINKSDDADIIMLKDQLNRPVFFDPPGDGVDPFDRGFPEGPTKQFVAEDFSHLVADLNLNVRQQNEFLAFLARNTRSLNLFVKHGQQTAAPEGPTRSVINTVSKYIKPDPRDTTFDVCRNGCTVFHGWQGTVDMSKEILCPCGAPRFTNCTHEDCKGRSYDQCNKFAAETVLGVKRHKNRTSMRTVNYRSAISKLTQLYCLSLTKGNSRLLKYHEDRYKKDGKILDICDGTQVIHHQQKMKDNYLLYRDEFRRMNQGQDIDECSLGLTFFYDGGVNFKRSADSMWPLITSVINCNPSNRTKLGIGCSLSLLHNMSGSKVETFLLEFYAKELKALEMGMLFVVAGAEGKADRNVYLQARLLFMHVDTKALESVTCSKGSGSLMCSCCNLNVGFHNPILNKVNYPGNRNSMDINHLTRYIGESSFNEIKAEHKIEDMDYKAECNKSARKKASYVARYITCSKEQHQEKFYAGDKSLYHDIAEKTKVFQLDTRKESDLNMRTINAAIGIGRIEYPAEVRTQADRDRFVSSKLWYNELFPYNNMKTHMRFPYPDTRAQVKYRHVTRAEYCRDGAIGEANTRKYVANQRRLGKDLCPSHDGSHNGRHAVNPLMGAGLESFSFANVDFDEMHRAANAMKNIISLLKKDRAVSEMDRKYSAFTKKIPSLKHVNALADYQLRNGEEKVFDAIVNSTLISPLYKVDFGLKYPLQQTGYLKAHQCTALLTVYLSYALSFTAIHNDYKEFFARYAYDMACINDPCLDAETLREKYIPCIYETRMCQEGLFPESECIYIFHEIIDIIHHIEKYGHIRSTTCFFGERAMGLIKTFVTKGGVQYMKTMYRRYVTRENSIAGTLTNNMLYFTNHPVPQYSDFVLKLLGEGKTVLWHSADKDLFFQSLMTFIQSQCIDMVHERSPFYRLHKAFGIVSKRRRETNPSGEFPGFTSWMDGLNDIYRAGKLSDPASTQCYVEEVLLTDIYDFEEVCDGCIYLCDFLAIVDSVLNFNPVIHKKLITKGILFNCRGHEYGELAGILAGNRVLLRAGDNLAETWHRRIQYSSFFRCTDFVNVAPGTALSATQKTSSGRKVAKKISTASKRDRFKRTAANFDDGLDDVDVEVNRTFLFEEKLKFGQLNSCWRVSMKGDKLVHGLAFANVTFRKATFDVKRRHYSLSAESFDTFRSPQKFICVNYIDSTSIGVSAISVTEDKPMLKPDGVQSFIQWSDVSNKSSGYYAAREAVLDSLYMLELHPERMSYRYEDILIDEDGTKLWEH